MLFSSTLPGTLAGLAALALLSASFAEASCHRRSQRESAKAHVELAAKATSAHSPASRISTARSSPSSSSSAAAVAKTPSTAKKVASSGSSAKLIKEYAGTTFFDGFQFKNISDPTNGLVSYVSASDAWARNLVSVTKEGTVLLSIDRTSDLLALNEPRASVRIESTETYNAGTLFIADFRHAPVGCGAWPAWWLFGANWPQQGEIDIFEGVNDRGFNTYTLHTAQGCTLDPSGSYTGSNAASSADCYAYGASSGCGIQDTEGSYGAEFNAQGGGVFAVQFLSSGISIHRFPRANIPEDILAGEPDPSGWGTPVAHFGGGTCDVGTYFKDLWMAFDITTCGDWAGAVYGDALQSGSCTSTYATCAEAVRHADAFKEAYFEIGYVRVYSV
ncbi:hypothetical protein JCM10450v2_004134 [Rhodotorula kratochvilovae]